MSMDGERGSHDRGTQAKTCFKILQVHSLTTLQAQLIITGAPYTLHDHSTQIRTDSCPAAARVRSPRRTPQRAAGTRHRRVSPAEAPAPSVFCPRVRGGGRRCSVQTALPGRPTRSRRSPRARRRHGIGGAPPHSVRTRWGVGARAPAVLAVRLALLAQAVRDHHFVVLLARIARGG
jgi:hypothetical protein